MAARLPKVSDFDSSLTLSITPPPSSQKSVNLLILLHGLGDSHEAFKQLGQQLNLPETACISLQGPTPLPFDMGGHQWGEDLVFDQGTGQLDFDTGFKKSTEAIMKVIMTLKDKCGYSYRDILLFGFGQGGMAALNAAASMHAADELSGVVSIGASLPGDAPDVVSKSRTPVIVLGGSSQSLINDSEIQRLRSRFMFVERKEWKRPGDSMLRNRDEMMPIMQFFARRLKSRQGVPEGSVEL
ncbi:hypothetical protein MMC10_000979 [Thelotrema lepadinum]|nr:hypothetical protein [Thelotrema lepadinum]